MFNSPLIGLDGFQQVVLDNLNTGYNLAVALGNPTYPISVLVQINSNSVISSFTTGNLNPSSLVRVINEGYILGVGGRGGDGGFYDVENNVQVIPAQDGQDGGPAVTALCPIEIDSQNGFIWGGGGGGGGSTIRNAFGFGRGGGGGVSGGGGGAGESVSGDAATSGINASPGVQYASGGSWGEAGATGGTRSIRRRRWRSGRTRNIEYRLFRKFY